jgi:hypothetical protein
MKLTVTSISKAKSYRWLLISVIGLSFYACQSVDLSNKNDKRTKVKAKEQSLGFDISSIPNFCSHEHWGSIDAVGGYVREYHGFYSDVYAGATPLTAASIWDLFLDPYFGGMIKEAGIDYNASARSAGYNSLKLWWEADPQAALLDFKNTVTPQLMTGTFQCLMRGIEKLYGVKISSFDVEEWQKADSLIQANYSEIFTWYQKAMKLANFSELIRPVQPEFYFMEQSA